MTVQQGTHRARGVEGALGYTSKGGEEVAIRLLILDGPSQGHHITWHGYFTEKTESRTLEALRHLGWEGDELWNLVGIDRNEVEIVVEEEADLEGVLRPRVRWINALGGIALKQRMSEADARAFSARMKGTVVAHRQKLGAPATATQTSRPAGNNASSARRPAGGHQAPPPPTDDDIPFAVNEGEFTITKGTRFYRWLRW